MLSDIILSSLAPHVDEITGDHQCGLKPPAFRHPMSILYSLECAHTYRVYHLKRSPKAITYYGTEMKSEAGPPPCNRLFQPPP
jgi:hypothetical protein